MIISEQRVIDPLLAFIHIEKTAGTTISHLLRSTYGIRHCEVQPLGKQKDVFLPFSPADLRLTLRRDDERQRRLDPAIRRRVTLLTLPLLLHYRFQILPGTRSRE